MSAVVVVVFLADDRGSTAPSAVEAGVGGTGNDRAAHASKMFPSTRKMSDDDDDDDEDGNVDNVDNEDDERCSMSISVADAAE